MTPPTVERNHKGKRQGFAPATAVGHGFRRCFHSKNVLFANKELVILCIAFIKFAAKIQQFF
jgi:hypothetical protein